MVPQIAPLTPEELALFNEFLSSRLGLTFPEHKREILASRLEPRLRANRVQRFIDYYLLLQYDPERELDHLIRAVTNNESYFFRETSQFDALTEHALDDLRAGGVRGQLRLLSAGCSSGEEPYSLNVHLRCRRPELALGNPALRIDAFDVDPERIEMARRAVYRPSSLRALPEDDVARLFVRHADDAYELRPRFRDGVRFGRGNLLDVSSYPTGAPYDVVFCRNVLIYFSESALKATIDNFARVVRSGGLLFLGHSESIIGLTSHFQAERLGQSIAYRRS